MSVNVLMKFHEEITELVRVVAPEIKFCPGQITKKTKKAGDVLLFCDILS